MFFFHPNCDRLSFVLKERQRERKREIKREREKRREREIKRDNVFLSSKLRTILLCAVLKEERETKRNEGERD